MIIRLAAEAGIVGGSIEDATGDPARPIYDFNLAVERVADAIKSYDDKAIRVVGHTDNVPISGALQKTYASNWELSVARARHEVLKPFLKERHTAIGSINSPMQCMMKEICAQCLQPHVDPATGKTTYVFSCFNQDQPLDQVDFGALAQRLAQNGVQEKLTALWIDRCLKLLPPPAERKAA